MEGTLCHALSPGQSSPMDCRTFRNKHLAFIDDTLPGDELVAMQLHVGECCQCSHHDRAIRRGLMVFRNLPTIEPSDDFGMKLAARLHQASCSHRSPALRAPGLGTFAVVATVVFTSGVLAASALHWTGSPRDLALPPVVATLPEPQPSPLASDELVASVTSGMPVWPAALLADQAPVHFARTEFRLASW